MSQRGRGVSLREADLARDQRRRRAGQGLHRPVRRGRAARAAPAARRRPRLPDRHRARGRPRRSPTSCSCCRPSAYGYTGHVMDFPGTINTDFEHFMHHVLDITKSLAYHGFKKIILLNGHGSNMPNLDLVARRTNLETDAECVLIAWWNLLTVDKDVPAALAAEQVPRRLRARLRAGDVALPLPRRRQRPQGPDQERRRSASTRRTARSTGSTVRRRPGDGDLVDDQLLRDRRARRGRAGDRREGATAYEEAVKQLAFVTGSRTGRRTSAATGTAAADDADPVGPDPGPGAV